MSSGKHGDRQWLWLLLWTILGAGLRLTYLDDKPPWTDEFRTIVLSLGNSFQSVPLDRIISFQDLLAPLIPNPRATIGEIVARVSMEDRQPPIYFGLAHWWMQLFPTQGGFANLWGARALAAGWGILLIPCTYVCSYLAFGWQDRAVGGKALPQDPRVARSIANFTAAMVAVSPYGVFISQEARHYSLAIVWVTISVSCLAIGCQYLDGRQKLPIWLMMVWVVVNVLGLGTHYFFSIVLFAQFITVWLVWWHIHTTRQPSALAVGSAAIAKTRLVPLGWRRSIVVLLGTIGGGAVWWWLLASNYDRTISAWINNEPHKLIEVFNPVFQILGAAISMMSLLLVEVAEFPPVAIFADSSIDLDIPIVILSAIVMLIFFGWVLPLLDRGVRMQWRQPQTHIGTIAICAYTASSIGLYLAIPWITGIDITRGARFHFGYFPGVMMLIGLGLASCWQHQPSLAKWVAGKQAVTIVLLMGLVSSAIVITNYGYHKYYRPEQIVPMIQQSHPVPVLIATTHNNLIQVSEMMGLAWEMRRSELFAVATLPQFLSIHQAQKICDRDCHATKLLKETIERFATPIDLWAVNFDAPVSLPPTCDRDKKFTRGVYGYRYQLYHCHPIKDTTS